MGPSLFQRLFAHIRRLFPACPLYVMVALSKDKEIKRCLEAIAPYATALYLPTLDSPRLVPSSQLKQELNTFFFQGAVTCGEMSELTRHAQRCAQLAGGQLIVTGSFYMMQAAKKALA